MRSGPCARTGSPTSGWPSDARHGSGACARSRAERSSVAVPKRSRLRSGCAPACPWRRSPSSSGATDVARSAHRPCRASSCRRKRARRTARHRACNWRTSAVCAVSVFATTREPARVLVEAMHDAARLRRELRRVMQKPLAASPPSCRCPDGRRTCRLVDHDRVVLVDDRQRNGLRERRTRAGRVRRSRPRSPPRTPREAAVCHRVLRARRRSKFRGRLREYCGNACAARHRSGLRRGRRKRHRMGVRLGIGDAGGRSDGESDAGVGHDDGQFWRGGGFRTSVII